MIDFTAGCFSRFPTAWACKHNEELAPKITRSTLSVIMALGVALVAVTVSAFAVIDTAVVIAAAASGAAVAQVPLPENALAQMLDATGHSGELTGTGFAALLVDSVPDDLLGTLVLAQVLDGSLTVLLGALAVFATIRLIVGKLKWRELAALTTAAGVLLLVGSLVAQALSSSSGEDLAIVLFASDGSPWTEPGFFSGFDFTLPATGALLALLGMAFWSSARFARDADGVV